MSILTFTETLTIKTCPVCSVRYAAPEVMFNRIYENGGSWYCPNGHNLVFGQSKIDQLTKQLEQYKENTNFWRERTSEERKRADQKDHVIRAQKAAKTRMKNRIHNGVCPCCNRTFQNLARHMEGQHPEFVNHA